MNDAKRLKQSVKMSDVFVAEGYKLEKVGDGFKAQCVNPEHGDKNPSLSIKDDIENFQCWSCGIHGDIFNLLDYIRPDVKGFRNKIGYFDEKYYGKASQPTFSLLGKEKKVENFQDEKDFRKIMNYIAKYCSQKLPKEVKDKYVLSTEKLSYKAYKGEIITMQGYNLSDEIVEEFQIGFSPNSKELYNELLERFDKELIEKTGLFDNRGMPLFKNRIVVPYIVNGDVVYFMARQTEFTPPSEYEKAKYKAQPIDNKYLYNEVDIESMSVFITEGEFDTLALKTAGHSSFSLGGLERYQKSFSKLVEGIKETYLVYICFDNDKNKAGNKKAVKLQEQLKKEGIDAIIITLPLLEGEKKTDINQYLGNNSKEDFEKLLTF